jgi:hypothetical protein
MKRIVTATPLADLPSATFNALQDRALAARAATDNNDLGAMAQDTDGVIWAAITDLAAGTTRLLDKTSFDWRDREIRGDWVTGVIGGGDFPGGATDYAFNTSAYDAAGSGRLRGYTGTGAVSHLTTGAAVSNGNPPLNGAGAFRSYTVWLGNPGVVNDVRLWVDPSNGRLNVYNASGGAVQLLLWIEASGKTGKRP